MRKIVFFGFMASMLVASGAALAETKTATLTTKDYVDTGLVTLYRVVDGKKADKEDVYTKTEANAKFLTEESLNGFATTEDIADLATADNVYTIAEADEKFLTEHQDISGKANVEDVYSKAEADTTFLKEHQDITGKANVDDVYTKEVADEKFLTPPEMEENDKGMYLYTNDGWSEITVKQEFPADYNFGG